MCPDVGEDILEAHERALVRHQERHVAAEPELAEHKRSLGRELASAYGQRGITVLRERHARLSGAASMHPDRPAVYDDVPRRLGVVWCGVVGDDLLDREVDLGHRLVQGSARLDRVVELRDPFAAEELRHGRARYLFPSLAGPRRFEGPHYGVRVHSALLGFGGSLLDAKNLLETFGVAGLAIVLFAETGLLIGFFLPGDSLIALGGLVAAVGAKSKLGVHIDLWVLLVTLPIAAIAGAQVGYLIGRKAGPALFNRPKSRLFKPAHVEKAHAYFDHYGASTIVIARFVPIVRTFANPVAGVAEMPPATFTIYNVIGGVLWTIGVTMLGFVLGKTIPSAENHLVLIEACIIVASLVPAIVEILRARRHGIPGSPKTTPVTAEPVSVDPAAAPEADAEV